MSKQVIKRPTRELKAEGALLLDKLITQQLEEIAVRYGFTKTKAIKYAIKKSGINNEEEGASRHISATVIHKDGSNKEADEKTMDFVKVPDEAIQFKWFQELCDLIGWKVKELPKEPGVANYVAIFEGMPTEKIRGFIDTCQKSISEARSA